MAKEPEAKKDAAAATAAAPSGKGGMLPILAVVVLVPALSFGMVQFLVFPKMEKMLADVAAAAGSAEGDGAHASADSKKASAKDKGPKPEATFSYEFKDIVSNLTGSMKSRYIKVSFTAYSADPTFAQIVDSNKAKLLDATLSVLGSLSLVDVEDPGVKNKVRGELVFAYESVLRGRVVEEIYFSEFVIQ
ncbi:hypothetical protein ASA1KI_09710 [Opitutales bacterium ASA1]|jgi:flagellar FliL protein|uniref:flagellar basal body-associated FliL family protein n=1 Tax=Congregicoccus parvus TaxID=3081749 RepID=UPI002B30157E|nr:hypothetical protein ASA1KI_09710 [Opitutales bacterium ASA1]